MTARATSMGISWGEYESLSLAERAAYFSEAGRLYHVMVAQQFDRSQLDDLGTLATTIRRLAKTEEGIKFLQSQIDPQAGHVVLLTAQQPYFSFLLRSMSDFGHIYRGSSRHGNFK
jgi:hypothetical protein